jgi:hypothetical protein
MTKIAWQMHAMLVGVGVSLYTAVWIKGSLNVEVDAASQWVDTDNWCLCQDTLEMICLSLGLWSVNCFADHWNHTVLQFNSLFAVPRAKAVNTFSQSWAEGVSLLVPLFCLILWVLHHLVELQAVAILFCPHWEAQPWWPVLMWVSTRSINLGLGHEAMILGLSGECELAWGWWTMQVHVVDRRLFQMWHY